MPEINQASSKANYKFKGHTVAIAPHFAEGHVLSANDAKFANRQLASVIGNMLGQALNRKVEALQKAEDAKESGFKANEDGTRYQFTAADVDGVQALTDEIYTNYEIGVSNYRTGDGSSTRDPVKSIADNIAWERIKVLLGNKNIKVGSVKAEQRAKLIAQLHEKDPSILVQAKATYEGSAADASTDGLDLSVLDAATDAGPTPPDSAPSSTTETDGQTAADLGTSPSNPGTVGTTEEGTGQGTPEDNEAVVETEPTPEEAPSPAEQLKGKGAFS